MRISSSLVVLLLASPSFGSAADEPVTIKVTPGACVAPCSVRVSVRVTPDAHNDSVTIAAESPEFYRSSTRPLDGAEAAQVHELILTEIPAGAYEVTVTVTRPPERPRHLVRQLYVKGTVGE